MNISINKVAEVSTDMIKRVAHLVDSATEAGIETITQVYEDLMSHFGEDQGMAVAS